MIFDEAHKLKEKKSKICAAVMDLKTRRRYGLTGTAIQNNYDEVSSRLHLPGFVRPTNQFDRRRRAGPQLYTLLNALTPNCLGERKDFHDYYTKPMARGQKRDATPRQLASGKERGGLLTELVLKWLLRRDKSLIADQLPGKDDMVVFCKLSSMQVPRPSPAAITCCRHLPSPQQLPADAVVAHCSQLRLDSEPSLPANPGHPGPEAAAACQG